MRELVIDRTKWYRGKGSSYSALMTTDASILASNNFVSSLNLVYKPGHIASVDVGKMCCLGFDMLACGVAEEYLRSAQLPSHLLHTDVDAFPEQESWLLTENADPLLMQDMEKYLHIGEDKLEVILAVINDSELITAVEREKFITKVFAQHDVQVTFIN